MLDGERLYQYSYTGPLAPELESFLSEKRRTGHKYNAESCYLATIDRLSIQMNTERGVLSKELVDLWTQKTDTETHKTWQNRVVVIRQLARFLKAQDIKSYETPIRIRNKRSAELTERCRMFMEKIHPHHDSEKFYFPAPDGSKYSKRAITYMFHQILSAAGISRTEYGPRIHDLRHTFSVNCLKNGCGKEKT